MELHPPQTLKTPKAGNRPEECEDAYRIVYPFRLGSSGKDIARIALSDGASEAAFARSWAQILADDFVNRPPDLSDLASGSIEEWLAPGQRKWNRAIPWDRIPWHGEAKARAGALATLLGLTISRTAGSSRSLDWQAVAVGDSCLFLVRQDELITSFPLDDAGQFDNTPALLCSNPANSSRGRKAIRQTRGTCQTGDRFILASDALACWFLAQHAVAEKPWKALLALDAAHWEAWVQAKRRDHRMRNDDATLIVVTVL